MRVAILFGAGASFGAGPVAPETPPLGADLFGRLCARFPGSWGSLDPDMERGFRDNGFESGMEVMWRGGFAQQPLLDMTRYFAEFRSVEKTAYDRVVAMIEQNADTDHTTFASLNYDCLLEQSLRALGRGVSYTSKRNGEPFVLKPHGSCNWIMPRSVTFTSSTMTNVGTYYEGPLECVWPDEMLAMLDEGYSMPGAMSLYAPGKPSPVAPTFIAGIRQQWADAVAVADLVVTIGARPFIEDEWVWGPIISRRAWTLLVGDQGDPEFRAALGDRLETLSSTFDGALTPLASELATH